MGSRSCPDRTFSLSWKRTTSRAGRPGREGCVSLPSRARPDQRGWASPPGRHGAQAPLGKGSGPPAWQHPSRESEEEASPSRCCRCSASLLGEEGAGRRPEAGGVPAAAQPLGRHPGAAWSAQTWDSAPHCQLPARGKWVPQPPPWAGQARGRETTRQRQPRAVWGCAGLLQQLTALSLFL